jgi:hypothetical protein
MAIDSVLAADITSSGREVESVSKRCSTIELRSKGSRLRSSSYFRWPRSGRRVLIRIFYSIISDCAMIQVMSNQWNWKLAQISWYSQALNRRENDWTTSWHVV